MQHLYGDTSTTVTIIYISYQIDHDQQTFLPSSQSQLQHLEKKQQALWLLCEHVPELNGRKILAVIYATYFSSCEKKAWKNSGLNGNQTHDLCDAGAVLYQMSYQANW